MKFTGGSLRRPEKAKPGTSLGLGPEQNAEGHTFLHRWVQGS